MGDLVALGCQRLRVLGQGVCNVVRSGRTVRTLKAANKLNHLQSVELLAIAEVARSQAGNFFGPDLTKDERNSLNYNYKILQRIVERK